MSKLEIFIVRVEGDAATISSAFEMVRRQLETETLTAAFTTEKKLDQPSVASPSPAITKNGAVPKNTKKLSADKKADDAGDDREESLNDDSCQPAR